MKTDIERTKDRSISYAPFVIHQHQSHREVNNWKCSWRDQRTAHIESAQRDAERLEKFETCRWLNYNPLTNRAFRWQLFIDGQTAVAVCFFPRKCAVLSSQKNGVAFDQRLNGGAAVLSTMTSGRALHKLHENGCILDQNMDIFFSLFYFRPHSAQKWLANRFMTRRYYIICLKTDTEIIIMGQPNRKQPENDFMCLRVLCVCVCAAAAWRKRYVRCRHREQNAHNA